MSKTITLEDDQIVELALAAIDRRDNFLAYADKEPGSKEHWTRKANNLRGALRVLEPIGNQILKERP